MDFMDLLLAEAIAAGMARQAAEARQRPPPDNFFILPPDPQAWRKLYTACKEEHMVICVEITDDSHPGSRRAQPLFVELAREVSQIPFFRVKIGFGRTYDELRQDLGGVRFTPTILVIFFDDGGNRIARVEGEDEIRLGLRTGAIERVIKEYIDQRMKLKLSERLAEELFKGAVASEIERRKRQAQLEYEERLKKEREEMERKEMERKREENRRLEEEKKKKLEAEREEEMIKRRNELDRKRAEIEDELLLMDLSTMKIRDIKEKMTEAGIGHVGATSRADLIHKLKDKLPRLKNKLESSGVIQESGTSMSGYFVSNRRLTTNETDGRSGGNVEDVTRLKRRIEQLERNVEELEQRREHLSNERDSLQRILRDKEEEIRQKNKELSEQKGRKVGLLSRHDSQPRVKELEDELMETRLLYSCTLDDLDIMGIIAKKEDGAVVRVKCTKPGLPNPSRVFAMKVVSNVMETSTMTAVRTKFKTEYEVLSGLPQHDNIIKLFAFFYDRPKTNPKLKGCGEGMALCVLMEQLSQNMEEHMNTLKRAGGPMASKTISWIQDIVAGSYFLYSHNVVHRDMKMENLLMSANGLKICDFGVAIRMDSTMKVPFTFSLPRGGNDAHLAPEILNTRPAPGKYLNYTKQPVWDCGVLAYELAGHKSPFEKIGFDQRAYDVSSLPRLTSTYSQTTGRQQSLPSGLTTLVKSMLEFDPDDRPSLDQVNKQIFAF